LPPIEYFCDEHEPSSNNKEEEKREKEIKVKRINVGTLIVVLDTRLLTGTVHLLETQRKRRAVSWHFG
jgi:hypothetical protein